MSYTGVYTGGMFDPATGISIERLIDAKSLSVDQKPTELGDVGKIQLEFGAAVNTASDPVQLLADGTLLINESGMYRLKISLAYGRTGSGGVAKVAFRALVNGVQAGQSVGTELDNARSIVPFVDEAWLNLSAGLAITYEIMRDSSGVNAGGLIKATITTGTAPNWNAATTAALRVERWSKT